ncbi:zinc finger protein 260-like [Colias croceus]|uniref:zinc finger protein 260-like n=1 Tax=Colias crocea TaxID=72248 RepID=UPI001E27EC7E|nr:zinc finger protein 260-like [Colias croceus]
MASSTPQTDSNWSILKLTTIDLVGGIYCNICNETFGNKREYDAHYIKHTGSKDILYTCVICRKEVAGYPSFRGHCYSSHVIKGRYKCDSCDKFFSKLPALQYHVKIMHPKSFRCSTCKKKFPTKKELRLHEVIHTDSTGPISCLTCHKDISSIDICKKHVDLHLSFEYTCPICEENIPSKENSADHLRKHFGNVSSESEIDVDPEEMIEQLGAVSCIFCSMICKNRVEFDAHFSCEHGDEDIVYSCIVCGRQFDKYSLFRAHINNHFTNNRFECDLCHTSFPRLSPLVSHMAACAAGGVRRHKLFACTRCTHRYGTEPRLREHMRAAHGVHVRRCLEPGCGKVFDKLRDMVVHQRQHHANVQNWCRQCGQLFTSLVSCEQHLDAHKKTTFPCPVCNQSFREKYLLLRHLPHHFETVLHLCKVCGKVYNAKNRLIEHLNSHADTKIHRCTYCPKTFPKLWTLQQHLNTHTGLKPNKCQICDKAFCSYPNWRKHMIRFHSVSSTRSIEIDEKNSRNYENNTLKLHCNEDSPVKSVIDQSGIENNTVNTNRDNWDEFVFYDQEDSEISMEAESMDQVIEKQLQLFGSQEQNVEYKPMPIEIPQACPPTTETSSALPSEAIVPLEYGPEFSSSNLDEYILPHIDPLLTIRNDQVLPTQEANYITIESELQARAVYSELQPFDRKWEPPMITKLFPDYYSYDEASRITVNADIF